MGVIKANSSGAPMAGKWQRESAGESRAGVEGGCQLSCILMCCLLPTALPLFDLTAFGPCPPATPQMANNLEGGGKTPLLTPGALEDMGFKLCAYPLSMLGVSVHAMEDALAGLRTGRVPLPPTMPSFQVLQKGDGVAQWAKGECAWMWGVRKH